MWFGWHIAIAMLPCANVESGNATWPAAESQKHGDRLVCRAAARDRAALQASTIGKGVRAFHWPRVKSGKSTDLPRCATDCSLSGAMTLQSAAS